MYFSIIIPAFNAQKYLKSCLESVLGQTFSDFEIILVDDGSTDESVNQCENIFKEEKRLKVFHKENGGQFSARKYGISKADGQYILFLDSDDMLRTDCLEILKKCIDNTKAEIVIFNATKQLDYLKPIQNYDFPNSIVFSSAYKLKMYETFIKSNSLNPLWAKAYHKELFKDVLWDDELIKSMRIGEDLMQLLPVITRAKEVAFCNEILYYYRPNNSAISNKYHSNGYETRKIIYNELCEYAKKWGIYNHSSIELLNLRTMRNIVSLLKRLKHERFKVKKAEFKRIANDEWGRAIYKSINCDKLAFSERCYLFLLYNKIWFPLIIILV